MPFRANDLPQLFVIPGLGKPVYGWPPLSSPPPHPVQVVTTAAPLEPIYHTPGGLPARGGGITLHCRSASGGPDTAGKDTVDFVSGA